MSRGRRRMGEQTMATATPYSIMHISDLHRSPDDPISNEELVSALLHDRDRYMKEEPGIPAPQAIVVSGDLIEGVRLGAEDFTSRIEEQYAVAEELLSELATRFLDGDRSRLVMVPGNHDVDWNTAFSALVPVDPSEAPKNLAAELYAEDSLFRWDWNTRTLYRIAKREMYDKRLEPFWCFFERFYAGTDGPRKANESYDARVYDLFGGLLGVAAFNSCDGNDCFAYHGRVQPESVAGSDLRLRDSDPMHELRLAVWHHSIEGSPYRSDYMDVDIVRGMIGRGFRLGLHGHQHRAQARSQEIRLPSLESMAVISAGSLCAGRRQLPTGTYRQYNVIQVTADLRRVRTHVREMAVANVFSRATLLEFGGASYMDLPLGVQRNAVGQAIDERAVRRERKIETAEVETKGGNPIRALEILDGVELPSGSHERQLYVDAAEAAEDWEALARATNPPTSIAELVQRFSALCRLKDYQGARGTLALHARELNLPETMESELRLRLESLMAMKG